MSAEDFELWPFQRRVFDAIVKDGKKRVIVQAPTGAGKTRAALAPYIHHLSQTAHDDFLRERLPLTCRYAVPTRTLANQFYREYENLARLIDESMPTRIEDRYRLIERQAIAIQTGEQSDDPQMEAALTFCTIDQLLASSIAIPYGLGKNLANINVAAIAGSYLILDEVHLYPLARSGKSCFGALTTCIKLLSMLKETTSFVLMTATFSTSLLNKLATLLDAVVVTVTDPTELAAISGERERFFTCSPQEMTAQTVLEQFKQCSLVICNTVARAQKIWRDLKEKVKEHNKKIEVILLHSRFTDERRTKIAKNVEKWLGPASEDDTHGWRDGVYYGPDIIVVATQVVEVGLNISVDTLHTEIAPANSIIQRAGRCARFAKQHGTVIVYPLLSPSDSSNKKAAFLPYDEDLCTDTWNALQQMNGRIIGFKEEQELVNTVHEKRDQELLQTYEANQEFIFTMIIDSFKKNDRNVSSELIRDVAQVQILIHDDPNNKATGIIEMPWLWQSFSLHPQSFLKWWKMVNNIGEKNLGVEWICRKMETYTEDDPNEPDNALKTKCQWEKVLNDAQLFGATMVVVPRKLALYDDEVGFMLLDGQSKGGDYQSVKRKITTGKKTFNSSIQRSYKEHISGLLRAYESHIWDDTYYVASRLEHALSLPEGIVDHAIRLAIACHDLGKLDKQWQQWAWAWQTFVKKDDMTYHLPNADFFFAKTDYDYSKAQREQQKLISPKRPHHACESVMLGRTLIGDSLGITKNTGKEKLSILRAICGAIAQHHTSQASQYGKARLDEHTRAVVDEVLQKVKGAWNYDIKQLHLLLKKEGDLKKSSVPLITQPEDPESRENILEVLLYFVIVRALRLADQRA